MHQLLTLTLFDSVAIGSKVDAPGSGLKSLKPCFDLAAWMNDGSCEDYIIVQAVSLVLERGTVDDRVKAVLWELCEAVMDDVHSQRRCRAFLWLGRDIRLDDKENMKAMRQFASWGFWMLRHDVTPRCLS